MTRHVCGGIYYALKGGEISLSERNMSIVYSSRIDKLTECNSSFDRGVLRVCYVGKNRNNSFISKGTFERCIDTIFNCPIVCRYDRDEDEIGAHDMELARDRDGNLDLINITHPVGVIPESAKWWFEEVEEDDGSIHEYLCVDALIWKRQEAYKKIKADGITDESMEITIKDGHMEDGVYIIDSFEFTAFCLLGTAEPCYESASLLLFSQESFKKQFSEMMAEFKESFSLVQSSQEVVNHNQNILEGGEEAMDEKRALMAQYGLSEDMLDFDLDSLSVEELTEKFEALTAGSAEEPAENPDQDSNANFALAEQFMSELITALHSVTMETCFGEMNRYWYCDYDPDVSEVYAHDCEDWNLYGFSYSMSGDCVVIDFESKKRKKFAIVDFDEGEQSPAFASVFSLLETRYSENDSMWSQKYTTLESEKTEMESELTSLRSFKAEFDIAADNAARSNIFAQFEDLVGIEAFDALREENSEFTIEEVEEKCYALRGRHNTKKFTVEETRNPKLPVEQTHVEDEPYGGIFIKYNIR